MTKKELDFKDLIDNVSHHTGYQKKDVEVIIRAFNDVLESAIGQGYGVKNHKLFRIEVVQEQEREAWDGINKKYYTLPDRYAVRYKTLSRIQKSIDELNDKQ